MKIKMLFFLLAVVLSGCTRLGGIQGLVMDRDTGLPVSGVEVVVLNMDQRSVTDEVGMYSLTMPGIDFVLLFTKEGYDPARIDVTDMRRSKWYRIDVALIPSE